MEVSVGVTPYLHSWAVLKAATTLQKLDWYARSVVIERSPIVQEAPNTSVDDSSVTSAVSPRITSAIAKRVAALRSERGWTVEELAVAADITAKTVASLEAGDRDPSPVALYAVSCACDVPMRTVLGSTKFATLVPTPEHQSRLIAEMADRINRRHGSQK